MKLASNVVWYHVTSLDRVKPIETRTYSNTHVSDVSQYDMRKMKKKKEEEKS